MRYNLIADIPVNVKPPTNTGIYNVNYTNPGLSLARVLTTTIGVMTIIAAIWFLFQVILGGIAIMSAGGDTNKLAGARQQITNGILGIIVVLSATALVSFVGWIFGITGNTNILNIGAWTCRIAGTC